MSMNTVCLTGRTTTDIEVKVSQNGTHFCNFQLAVDNGFGDKKETYFLPISAFGKTADSLAQFVKKGSTIGVTGMLTSSQYTTQQGEKRTQIKVVASHISFENLKRTDGTEAQNAFDEPVVSEITNADLPF